MSQEQVTSQTQELEGRERIELFLSSVKSPDTKEKYNSFLKKYMEITGITEKGLEETDPRLIEKQLITFVMAMKKQGMTFMALKNYTTAVMSFYKINDVLLNSHKINKFMPENIKVKNDRGYTREEIAKMLEIADIRSRVLILLLASTGMRVGAITSLKVRHVDEKNGYNKITIYENTADQYYSFVTPECKRAIDAYLDMRKRYGEKVTANSPLIRNQFDIRDPFAVALKKAKTVTSQGLQWILRDLSRRYNVIAHKGDVPIAHGFRYFWMSQAVECEMNPEVREMLLGHKIGLASAYYRPTVEKMFVEYSKAIDLITIDPAKQLEKQLQDVKQESSQVDKLKADMEKMEERMRRFDEERLPEIVKLLREGKAVMEHSKDGYVTEVVKVDKKGNLTKTKVRPRRARY